MYTGLSFNDPWVNEWNQMAADQYSRRVGAPPTPAEIATLQDQIAARDVVVAGGTTRTPYGPQVTAPADVARAAFPGGVPVDRPILGAARGGVGVDAYGSPVAAPASRTRAGGAPVSAPNVPLFSTMSKEEMARAQIARTGDEGMAILREGGSVDPVMRDGRLDYSGVKPVGGAQELISNKKFIALASRDPQRAAEVYKGFTGRDYATDAEERVKQEVSMKRDYTEAIRQGVLKGDIRRSPETGMLERKVSVPDPKNPLSGKIDVWEPAEAEIQSADTRYWQDATGQPMARPNIVEKVPYMHRGMFMDTYRKKVTEGLSPREAMEAAFTAVPTTDVKPSAEPKTPTQAQRMLIDKSAAEVRNDARMISSINGLGGVVGTPVGGSLAAMQQLERSIASGQPPEDPALFQLWSDLKNKQRVENLGATVGEGLDFLGNFGQTYMDAINSAGSYTRNLFGTGIPNTVKSGLSIFGVNAPWNWQRPLGKAEQEAQDLEARRRREDEDYDRTVE